MLADLAASRAGIRCGLAVDKAGMAGPFDDRAGTARTELPHRWQTDFIEGAN